MRYTKQQIYTIFQNILFLIILISGHQLFAAEDWQIKSISIKNETYLNQVVDPEAVFQWKFNHQPKTYNAHISIFQISEPKDSLILEEKLEDLEQNQYKITSSFLLQKGQKYKFQISAKNREFGDAEGFLEFTLNSLPKMTQILEKQNKIFNSDSIIIAISPSNDKEIASQSILYNLKISDFNDNVKVIIDTLVHEKNGKLQFIGKDLQENGKFTIYLRSFDGVEYSNWSEPINFFINRINEPPFPFSLMNNGETKIFNEKARLIWDEAIDPENLFGGKIINYIVQTSTFQDFTLIHEISMTDGMTTEFLPEKVENHRKYYWRIIAIDNDSLKTVSNEVGEFYINKKNSNPPKAKIISPRFNKILKPDDFIQWRQGRDEDKWDKLHYKINLYKNDKLITDFLLDNTTIDSSFNGLLSDVVVSYDNSLRIRLKYLLKKIQLTEGEQYQIGIETFDNWGGMNSQKNPETTFIFDDNVNFPPHSPITGFSPDSLIISSTNPTLNWDAAIDPDVNDRIKYEIRISTNPTFRTTRYIQETTGYGDNFINIHRDLLENKQYFWKVRSIDLMEKKSNWSKINTFWVNSINEAPLGPITLIYPENYTEFNSESSFWWIGTNDVDPGDRVKYLLELAPDKNFHNKIYSYLIPAAGQKAQWPENLEKPDNALGIFINDHPEVFKLIDNRMYYWRVTAIDNENLTSVNQSTYPRIVYNIKNDPPDIPAGFSPGKGKIVSSDTPTIRWQHSVDPDFLDLSTTLSYQLELSKIHDFPEDASKIYFSNEGDNFLKISDNLEENKKYFYRLNAFDSHDSSSGWSMADSFFVNAKKESPTKVTEMMPRDSVQLKTNSPLLKWNAVRDPDPDFLPERMSYQIKYIADKWIGHNDEKKKTTYITVQNGELSYQIKDLEENNYYSYQIEAIDQTGMKSGWSTTAHFSINIDNEFPSDFSLIHPWNGMDSVDTNPQFIWYRSNDPDPDDDIVYKFFLSEDSLFLKNVEEIPHRDMPGDSIYLDPYMELKRATKYFWKVSAEDKNGAVTWGSNSEETPFVFYTIGYHRQYDIGPGNYVLYDNMPNPFYNKTRIEYEVKEFGNVRIEVFNVLGGKVKTLVSRTHSAGHFNVEWDGTDESGNQVPGGMYLCRMTARGFMKNKKMLLLR